MSSGIFVWECLHLGSAHPTAHLGVTTDQQLLAARLAGCVPGAARWRTVGFGAAASAWVVGMLSGQVGDPGRSWGHGSHRAAEHHGHHGGMPRLGLAGSRVLLPGKDMSMEW